MPRNGPHRRRDCSVVACRSSPLRTPFQQEAPVQRADRSRRLFGPPAIRGKTRANMRSMSAGFVLSKERADARRFQSHSHEARWAILTCVSSPFRSRVPPRSLQELRSRYRHTDRTINSKSQIADSARVPCLLPPGRILKSWHQVTGVACSAPVLGASVHEFHDHTSVCSAIFSASSTSIPRHRTVDSILE